ncbi:MAG: hypothetical protein Q8Q14_14345 [Gemmatimonadales bacterium]|nr:hypothetical protein [Gemmatimonadales bacterium]
MGRRKSDQSKTIDETPAAEAAAPSAVEQVIAGPFALFPHHRNIWRSAATEKTRYVLNAVALLPDVPGLVATDGKILTMLPLQAVDPNGEPGPYGNNFRGHRHKDLILLPLEVFKTLPRKLEAGVNHVELTVIQQGTVRFAVKREVPYGSSSRTVIPDTLVSGQYPEFAGVIPEWEDRQPTVAACFDPRYVADLAKAIGDHETMVLCVFAEDGAAVMLAGDEKTPVTKRRARRLEPEGWQGIGVIMPVTLREDAHETAVDANARLKQKREDAAARVTKPSPQPDDVAAPAA